MELFDWLRKVVNLLAEAEEDILTYAIFPTEHWRKIYSTNPLEKLHKEVKRATQVVSIFPNERSLIRLVGALLSEQYDEWVTCRCYLSLMSIAELKKPEEPELPAELVVVCGRESGEPCGFYTA